MIFSSLSLAIGLFLCLSSVSDTVYTTHETYSTYHGFSTKGLREHVPRFEYQYGWSLYLVWAAFVFCAITVVAYANIFVRKYKRKKEEGSQMVIGRVESEVPAGLMESQKAQNFQLEELDSELNAKWENL